MQVHGYDVTLPWQGADHIARHDPARILREIAAKRAAVDFLDPTGAPDGESAYLAARVLALMTLTYTDHPDFQAVWRP